MLNISDARAVIKKFSAAVRHLHRETFVAIPCEDLRLQDFFQVVDAEFKKANKKIKLRAPANGESSEFAVTQYADLQTKALDAASQVRSHKNDIFNWLQELAENADLREATRIVDEAGTSISRENQKQLESALDRLLRKVDGPEVRQLVPISEDGILAAAHRTLCNAVVTWKNKCISKDSESQIGNFFGVYGTDRNAPYLKPMPKPELQTANQNYREALEDLAVLLKKIKEMNRSEDKGVSAPSR